MRLRDGRDSGIYIPSLRLSVSQSHKFAVFRAKFADFGHQKIGDFFMRPQTVGFFVKFGQINWFPKPNANFFAARPISEPVSANRFPNRR